MHPGEPARTEFVIEGIIAKLIVFNEIPDGIHAETIDAASEPKTHDTSSIPSFNGNDAGFLTWINPKGGFPMPVPPPEPTE